VITSWRIAKAKYATSLFDGEGARLFGGRWTSPGVSVVYTADSAALATLELLVHLSTSSVLPGYVLATSSFAEKLVSQVNRSDLPGNWRAYSAPPELQLIGDRWFRAAASAVLKVPSVVIETECNYLLNPQHKDFPSIRVSTPEPFQFDARLLDKVKGR
jgi:RES domain-containing protein